MKLLYSTLFVISLSGTTNAQSLISIASFKPIGGITIDSCAVPMATSLSTFPLSTPSTSASWNISSVTLDPAMAIYQYKSPTSGFSTASFLDSTFNTFGTSAAHVSYNSWTAVKQSSTSTSNLGEQILKRQATGLGSVTMNSIDSIVFPTQVMTYTRAMPVIKYTATMGSVWIDSAVRSLNFNLTVTAASLSSAPGVHKQYIKSIDSVVGWGRMKVPIIGKLASTWINVLQVHHYDLSVDSFFLNGSPASSIALSPLGLTQGQSTTVASTNFLRVNSIRPLVQAQHTGATHSTPFSRAYINQVDLEEAVSVSSPELGTITMFPNPVHGSTINVNISGGVGDKVTYTLTCITGQVVATGNMPATGTSINLPTGLASGIYYLNLTNQRGAKTTLAVEME